MKNFLIAFVVIGNFIPAFGQNSPTKQAKDWSIRANWNYQFYSFSGRRTNSNAIGGIFEKRINYEATLGLSLNYLTRMEDAEVQRSNMEGYNEVFYISPFVRKYFHKALEGPYTAFSVGLGIPKEKGTQWDAGGQIGYLIVGDKIAIDLMIQMGFGSYRHYEDYYNLNGKFQGTYFEVDYGFYFRPGISIGFAM